MGGEGELKEDKKRRDDAAQTVFQQSMQSQAFRDSWFVLKDTYYALSAQWLLVLIAVTCAATINVFVAPFTKLIPPIRDPSLSYPVGVEQVPEWLVGVLGILLPMALVSMISHCQDKADIGVSILALAQSCSYNMVSTVILKKIAGRPRPCFYAMCEWVDDKRTAEIGAETGLGFLTLFLLEKLAQHARRSQPFLSFGRALQYKSLQIACLAPIALACWIAETRTQDYWHNYDDILAGAAVGLAYAYWFFHQREGYHSVVREALRAPQNARNSDELVPMRDPDGAAGGDEAV